MDFEVAEESRSNATPTVTSDAAIQATSASDAQAEAECLVIKVVPRASEEKTPGKEVC